MDYSQVEEKFKDLQKQFTAGTLDEAAFKAQLNELMVQDEQEHWWMIGYETGQWYMHDGSAWVRADPPGRAAAKPVELPEPVRPRPEPEPSVQAPEPVAEPPSAQAVVQMPAIEKEPPVAQPAAQAPERATEPPMAEPAVKAPTAQPAQPMAKAAGFIPNRGREALLVLLGGVLYGGAALFSSLPVDFLTAPIVPLTGVFFGPWVGGLAGALGGLLESIIFSTRGFPPSEIPAFILGGFFLGFIPALLVKDARNWKSVLYACLLAAGPEAIRYIVLTAGNITDSYFWTSLLNNLTHFLIPILILTPLAARALIDWVRQRGWYWLDTPEPRKETLTDWKTIFILATVWGIVWILIYGLGRNLLDLSGSWMVYSLICGLASGLAAVLILRSPFPGLRWGQSLLALAGWGLGFIFAADAFTNVVANGYIQPDFALNLLILGAAGGFGLCAALKWAGVFSGWRPALISAAVWAGGMMVCALLVKLITDNYVTRLFYTGLLVGGLGAWGIFWQRQATQPSTTGSQS